MQNAYERLIRMLLDKNEHFTYNKARVLVEILWEDIEATYAKIGEYHGPEMTEKLVQSWIESHGKHFHHIVNHSEKYRAVSLVEDIRH